MHTKIQPVWQHAVAHRLRGHLDPEDLDTSCNNPFCTDPGCEGSCMVISSDGSVLQNLKGPRNPNACPNCYEDPCYCHELFREDEMMPCMDCNGSPCRCEPAEADDPVDYLDDPGYDDYYDPDGDYRHDPVIRAALGTPERADADGQEYLADALWAGKLSLMTPEARAEALREDRIHMLGFDPDAI